ncbi:tetratricopeptide repeat protein [Flavobacteriales bacterium]|nr:tetratricopeptide repeat protein [Flavobacteriales bacterium]
MKRIITIIFILTLFSTSAQQQEIIDYKIDSIEAIINNTKNDTLIIKQLLELQKITITSNEKKYFETALTIESICQNNRKKELSPRLNRFYVNELIELYNSLARKHINSGKNKQAFIECEKSLILSKEEAFESPRSDTYNMLGLVYLDLSNYSKAIENFNKSRAIRIKINDLKGVAGVLNNIGLVFYKKNNYERAIEFWKKSLEMSRKNKDNTFASNTLSNIGVLYRIKGDYVEAIKCYNQSMELNIKDGKEDEISGCLGNIGRIHLLEGNVDKAINYYEKGLAIEIKQNKRNEIANSYLNLGVCFKEKGELEKVYDYYEKALLIFQEIEDRNGVASVYNNLGTIQQDIGDSLIESKPSESKKYYSKAMSYYNKSLAISKEIKDIESEALNLHNMGYVFLRLGEFKKAIKLGEKALELNLKIEDVNSLKEEYEFLYLAYKATNMHKEALEMHERFFSIKDSVKSDEFKYEIERQEYQAEFNKREEVLKVKQQQKNELINEEEIRSKIILAAIILVAFLVTIFSIFIIRRLQISKGLNNTILKQQKEVLFAYQQLEEKNKEVMDSINYANRIQTAILPREKMIKELLNEAFIIYKPKDIVAGDFYWIEKSKDGILFAAADSTGHGVPGAMVSVVCNYALNRSLKEFGLTDPGKILDKTRDIVVGEFEKSDEDVKDGMDIALCSINGLKLKYSGANNPLLIVRESGLIIVKANKQPIGKTHNPTPFKTHEIQLKKEDQIYLFSDGFSDQFGGEKGKKLKLKPFKELILETSKQPILKQKEKISEFFEDWRRGYEQVDDVCIISIRV